MSSGNKSRIAAYIFLLVGKFGVPDTGVNFSSTRKWQRGARGNSWTRYIRADENELILMVIYFFPVFKFSSVFFFFFLLSVFLESVMGYGSRVNRVDFLFGNRRVDESFVFEDTSDGYYVYGASKRTCSPLFKVQSRVK